MWGVGWGWVFGGNGVSWGGDALSLFVDAGLGMKFRRCFWEAFVALAWAGLAGWPGALVLWLSRMLGKQLIIGSRSNLLSWGGVAQSPFVKRGLGMDFLGCLYRGGGGMPRPCL